jgi:hypothetical protein
MSGLSLKCAGPRRDWDLSHLCGLARQACLTIGKEQPMRPTVPGEPHFCDFHKDCSDQLATPLTGLSAGSYDSKILASEKSGGVMLETRSARTLTLASAQDGHHA